MAIAPHPPPATPPLSHPPTHPIHTCSYGFCQFENPGAAEAAIAALHGSSALGNPLIVSHFRRKKPDPGSDRPAVVVRNLPPDMAVHDVKQLFSAAGEG